MKRFVEARSKEKFLIQEKSVWKELGHHQCRGKEAHLHQKLRYIFMIQYKSIEKRDNFYYIIL